MSSNLYPHELPEIPKVRPGIFVYQAPAPVKIKANNLEALMAARDTIVIEFDTDRPEGMTVLFDWNVEVGDLLSRYEANQALGGKVNVWYERSNVGK